MSTKKNSPDVSGEFPEPVTGRHFVPVGRAADNDHDVRKSAQEGIVDLADARSSGIGACVRQRIQHAVLRHHWNIRPVRGRPHDFPFLSDVLRLGRCRNAVTLRELRGKRIGARGGNRRTESAHVER